MGNLEDKIKELDSLKRPYISKRDAEREKAQKEADKKDQEYKIEIEGCFSKIREVERVLSGMGIEIEDDEPFYRDRRRAHPEMGFRWILVKKADKDGLLVRKYSGDTGGKLVEEFKPTNEYPLFLIKALCDRLPGFTEVVTNKVKEALK